MPELPEVETVVRGLRDRLIRSRIRSIAPPNRRSTRTPRARFGRLVGRSFRDVHRAGKFIRMAMDDGRLLTAHLGMTGRLVVLDGDRPIEQHTHLQADLGRGRELRFVNPRWCMGGLWMLNGPADLLDPTAELGPDPLTISADAFVELLGSTRRQAKALLLDQRCMAGLGNIYCDEALFAARIHPRARCDRLSRPRRRRLWRAIRDVLADAIDRGGSTLRDYRNVDGDVGWFQLSLAAYGRAGHPCPACGKPISHATTAGRSTHYCTRCQRF
jgi:formamidopyrimidine-DNA glycosylase